MMKFASYALPFYTLRLLMRIYLLLVLSLVLPGCAQEPAGVTTAPTAVSTPTLSPTATTTPTELMVTTTTVAEQTPTPFPTPTITPTPTPILYTIQEGETLLGIAIAQGTTTEAIMALNPEVVPEALSIGQVIILPPVTAVSAAAVNGSDTAVPQNLTVSQIQTYETVVGSFWLVGEVTNAGEQAVENVQVALRFLNEAGEEVDTAAAWAANPLIAPGASAPFGVLLPQKPSYAQVDTAVAQGNVVADFGERYLDFVIAEVALNNDEPAAEISGVVQNVGSETAVSIQLIITLYDAEGNIVGFLIRPLADELAAGDEVRFTETAVSLAAPIEQVQIAAFAYKIPAE